ncbi:MAG: hypothetical protein ACK4TF_03540 [Thermodesulfovibrionales bacterium]
MQEKIYSILNQISEFIYENYQEDIQEAFEYFWEEEKPEDILHGMMLDMGELNFDDWLTVDYRNPYGEGFLELYEKYSELSEDEKKILTALKESMISLYEVEDVSNNSIRLKDLLRDKRLEFISERLSRLKNGDLFATRFITIDNEIFMGKCIYPFHSFQKDEVLKYLDMQFKRYLKNENPQGDIESFLKEASSVFNTVWLTVMGDKRRNE